jgi:pyruvate/2-oxoglutarate dehydrogenase complex dihydrolipoamide acyltransferase (E2) component
MFGGKATGWGMSAPGIHNLSVVIGGLASRPGTADLNGPHREVLCVTVSANHDLVDGAPVARFVRDFASRVEAAAVLDELEVGAT